MDYMTSHAQPMEHSELIAYARDHDEMQIVYGVRKSGTEALQGVPIQRSL